MATDLLNEQIEREAQRCAAAFGVEEPRIFVHDERHIVHNGEIYFSAWSELDKGSLNLEVHSTYIVASFHSDIRRPADERWCLRPTSIWEPSSVFAKPCRHIEVLKAAYCLGWDIDLFSHLGVLTAHEKLELRLSFPREFWPEKWLEEGE